MGSITTHNPFTIRAMLRPSSDAVTTRHSHRAIEPLHRITTSRSLRRPCAASSSSVLKLGLVLIAHDVCDATPDSAALD
ncbi:hypothetical protein C8T65DRAFT_744737 [Cerioporus squamosus]|nr:hypothetical protein C8T65DRAFT_744737 [Cerioporus squamosus]